ncbi:glycosyltransferase [Vagococcus fluvialis]|uniref:glycosyltransferase family 2 protein n=1 Tax=Vagococcus fluvialis TaxID=2738 RepID=UPI0037CD95A9
MDNDKISIIIPVYNGERTIRRAIESCINQTYENIEILVVNNGSTDQTLKILTSIRDERISVLTSDKGRSRARNLGLDRSTGQYILFLDADDALYEHSLERAVKFIMKNKEYFAYASCVDYYDELEKELIKNFVPKYKKNSDLEKKNPFPINSILFKRNTTRFDEDLEYNEDWLFFATALHEKKIFVDKDSTNAIVFIHGENSMSNLEKMIGTELLVKNRIKINNRKQTKFKISLSTLKLLTLYKLLAHESDIQKKVEEVYLLESIIATIMIRTPVLSSFLQKKLDDFKKTYHYY